MLAVAIASSATIAFGNFGVVENQSETTTAVLTTASETTTAEAESAAEVLTEAESETQTAQAESTIKKASATSAKATTEKATEATTTTTTTTKPASETCSITVECSKAVENGYTGSAYIISSYEVKIKSGDTVYDILKRACAENGVYISEKDTIYGKYIAGINGLSEKDYGGMSGWVYTVNGSSPAMSCAKYKVSAKDKIVFKYVTGD